MKNNVNHFVKNYVNMYLVQKELNDIWNNWIYMYNK